MTSRGPVFTLFGHAGKNYFENSQKIEFSTKEMFAEFCSVRYKALFWAKNVFGAIGTLMFSCLSSWISPSLSLRDSYKLRIKDKVNCTFRLK